MKNSQNCSIKPIEQNKSEPVFEDPSVRVHLKEIITLIRHYIKNWWKNHEVKVLKITMHCLCFILLAVNYIETSKDALITMPAPKVTTFGYEDLTSIYGNSKNRDSTNFIVVHHTATENSTVQEIADYHKKVRGWKSIAYHFVIKDKAVYKCHSLEKVTAGTYGHNTDAINICIVGDFSKREPTEDELKTLKATIDFVHQAYKKPKIVQHKDIGGKPTECCGIFLWNAIKDYVNELNN